MPRELLEHGGSESPAAEAQLRVQLRNEQEAWIRKEGESECHVLKKACETLAQSGFDRSHVALRYGHEDDIARNILEEARSGPPSLQPDAGLRSQLGQELSPNEFQMGLRIPF